MKDSSHSFWREVAIAMIGGVAVIAAAFITGLLEPEIVVNVAQSISGVTPTAQVIERIITTTPPAEIESQVVEVTREVEVTRLVPSEVTRVVSQEVTRLVTVEREVVVTATPVPATPTPETITGLTTSPGTNTPPDSILAVGQTWYQDGMEARIDTFNFAPDCSSDRIIATFELTIINTTNQTLVTNLTHNDFKLLDTANQTYLLSERCITALYVDEPSMAPGERFVIMLSIRGEVPDGVDQLFFTLSRAGRISNAKWVIDVPR